MRIATVFLVSNWEKKILFGIGNGALFLPQINQKRNTEGGTDLIQPIIRQENEMFNWTTSGSVTVNLPDLIIQIACFYPAKGRPGAWKFLSWHGKITCSPELFSKAQNFYFYGYFYKFQYASKVQILSETGFYDAKYRNLRPIFAAAQKNIFGKVVTILQTRL